MTEKPILRRTPAPGAIAEARENPGGWVYEIYGHFEPHERVPASAVVGAWKVDDAGSIVGEFIPNPNFVVDDPDADDNPPDPCSEDGTQSSVRSKNNSRSPTS